MSFDLSDYVDVAERIRIFRGSHPHGSLQSDIQVLQRGDGTPIAVLAKAWAYRAPDDEKPGMGHSWMAIPGTTPYTRGSEVENAETSAWGRAIVAALAADTKKVASADEVRSKQEVSGAALTPAAAGAATNPSPGGRDSSAGADKGAPAHAAAGASRDPGAFVWKYGEHAGSSIADTPLEYVIEYAEKGKVDWLREKCRQFLESGSAISPDDDIPF
jgi:hypothetical protein